MTYKILTLFTVKTKQGDLTLNPGQVITLVEEKAKKLIQEGKIKLVEQYEDYFKDTVEKVSQIYQAGTIDYVRRNHPERFQESLHIETRLNNFWDKDFQEFKKAAVDGWRDIELELIKLFTQKTN
ncbi:MAG: hypothetical protein HW390_2863 [Candidatus Brocadiaceae bacterium]|nr:hypothetical protein [Candidatus Brocadiaceae bacterium]